MCFCKSHVSKTVLLIGQRSPVYVLDLLTSAAVVTTLFQMFQRLRLHSCPNWSMTPAAFYSTHFPLWSYDATWFVGLLIDLQQPKQFVFSWVETTCSGDLRRIVWVQLPRSYIPKTNWTKWENTPFQNKHFKWARYDNVFSQNSSQPSYLLDWLFFSLWGMQCWTRDTSSLHISKQLQKHIIF